MRKSIEDCAFFRGLSAIGAVSGAILLGLPKTALDPLSMATLTMLLGVMLVLGVCGAFGWIAAVLSRRVPYFRVESAAFLGAVVGGIGLYVFSLQI